MKLIAVARAQTIYSLPLSFFVTVPIFDLVEALRDRYHFRQIPTGAEILNPPLNQSTSLIWGKTEVAGHPVTVESIQIQNTGIATNVSVVTRTSTDDTDAIMADLVEWVRSAFSLNAKPVLPTNYLSQLEFELDHTPRERLSFMKPMCDMITKFIRGYGFTACPEYEPMAFSLYFDSSVLTNPPTLVGSFSFDRRNAVPWDENRFYSQAWLKTKDHIAVLTELEKLL